MITFLELGNIMINADKILHIEYLIDTQGIKMKVWFNENLSILFNYEGKTMEEVKQIIKESLMKLNS